ncbi:MAG: SAM-dependent methyltransferase [Anaerolineae bacterium]
MSGTLQTNELLASTARWTAAVRAAETARGDRLFDDPWAARLAGEEGAAWIAQRSPQSTLGILLRTRYFDDFLERVTAEHRIRQVVIMAAGFDTRAYRLAWPEGTRFFELDQPEVLADKQEVLDAAGAQPTCSRTAIGVDLAEPWHEPLLQAGFAAGQAAVWLLEGFLFYIPTETLTRLLGDVADFAANGSWLGCDVINSDMLASPLTHAWVEMQAKAGAPWIGILDDPVGFLGSRGWSVTLTQAGQPDANYGRWTFPVIPTTMPNMPHNWFVTAEKEALSP